MFWKRCCSNCSISSKTSALYLSCFQTEQKIVPKNKFSQTEKTNSFGIWGAFLTAKLTKLSLHKLQNMGARQHAWRLQLFTFATLLCYHIYQFPNKQTLEAIQHWNMHMHCLPWITLVNKTSLKWWLLWREFSNKILALPKTEVNFVNANNFKAPVTDLPPIVSELLIQIAITSCCVHVYVFFLFFFSQNVNCVCKYSFILFVRFNPVAMK